MAQRYKFLAKPMVSTGVGGSDEIEISLCGSLRLGESYEINEYLNTNL